MILPRLQFAVALAVTGIGASACSPVDTTYASETQAIEWERCPAFNIRMRCGMLTVPESYAALSGDGPKIQVAFAISPATDGREGDDPVLVLLGGPGGSATGQLRGIMSDYKSLNSHRDVVLVDQRGTGRSSPPLHCTFERVPADSGSYGQFLPPSHVRDCAERLSASADVTRFRTSDFVEDLESLREALGVSQWNLHGTSYGSRAALQYMERYPERVRSAILIGVVPRQLRMPMTLGPDADAALDRVAADCSAVSDCARAYPDFRELVDSIARRLDATPAQVQVPHPETKKPMTVLYTREMFGMAVRGAMYTGWGASNLPSMIYRAHGGDFAPLMERGIQDSRRRAGSGVAGLYLAVTCGDDVARADRDSAMALNAASTMGAVRARRFFDACAEWPLRPETEDRTGSSTVLPPVLMMVGAADPATPPHWAEVAMETANDARLVVVPQGGHVLSGLQGMGCLRRLQANFLARPDPAALDVSCLREVRRPAFVIDR